jgi:polynucleotide 5'-hydroxyl-kinase GRC3/NOL9
MKDVYQTNHDWERIARCIVQPQQVVLVIGSTDVGKSTFCRFLVERGVSQGLKVGFVDADVGQSQIGPPTTIGFKIFSQKPDWLDTEADDLYFVGWTSPERHLLQCVTGVRLMVDTALGSGADFIVVDTTGYVEGMGAIALKQHKVELIRPSYLICIRRSSELDPIVVGFDAFDFMQIHQLSPHQAATSKTNTFRRKYREACFDRYFSETVEETLPFEEIRGQRTAFFIGRRANAKELEILSDLTEDRVIYAEWGHRTLALVTLHVLSNLTQARIKSHLSLTDLVAEIPEYFEGRFVGLVNTSGKVLSIGIIKEIDFQTNHLKVRCKAGIASETKFVQFGRYKEIQ